MCLKQKIDEYLRRFQENRLAKPGQCEKCSRSGHLHWHGQYHRSLITLSGTHQLPIRRLFCVLCRHTFALLPDFVAKFHRYAKETILAALKKLKTLSYDLVANWFMESGGLDIATLTLYLWRRKFV